MSSDPGSQERSTLRVRLNYSSPLFELMSDSNEQSIRSVETSFTLIEYLAENGPASVTQIADDVGRPKSTVHVHLNTLENNGAVVRSGGDYDLGLKFLDIGGQIRRRHQVYRASKGEVDKLADETEEAAHLGVEQNGQRVIIYKAERGDAVYDNTSTGEFTSMHWTAIGKALLAHLPEHEASEIITRHGLPEATENTITDRDNLFAQLSQARERGYTTEEEERRKGVMAVAVPIFDTTSHDVVAALSVSGPRERLREDGSIRADILESVRNRANVAELRYNHY